ncbi:MAG: matrixin family metalloprotease [Spirochaetia bacterium]|jgi:hypothetical protein|nr:matrixin family metalloprotease [Spirochaetia bacterium]
MTSAIIYKMKNTCYLYIYMFIAIFPVLTGCVRKNSAEADHVRKDFDVIYYINKEANLQTEAAVITAFRRWGEATVFRFKYAGRGKAGLKRDGRNTVSFLITWPDEAPAGKAAWCLNYYDRKGFIAESDIIFNMSLARFTTLETNTPDSYYIEGLLAHEIGHMLGLGHIDSSSSLMKPLSSREESYFMGALDDETITEYKKLYQQ